MATITEDRVDVRITLSRDINGADHAIMEAASWDSARGVRVRVTRDIEITGLMSAARLTGIKNLLDDATAKIKADWEIP